LWFYLRQNHARVGEVIFNFQPQSYLVTHCNRGTRLWRLDKKFNAGIGRLGLDGKG